MSYYFIAQIKIHDKKEYKKYTDKVSNSVEHFNGKYLAVDTNPFLLEGKWNDSRCVIIEFQLKKDFESWYKSKEYQEILSVRLNAADCNTILVKGLDED